jgi:hypothetical protein
LATWLYSDWRTYSGAAATARLALHLGEIEEKITADVSADGKSRSSASLIQLYERLEKQWNAMSIGSVAGGMSVATFRKPT